MSSSFKSSHQEPLLTIPSDDNHLLSSDNETTVDKRRHTDSFVIKMSDATEYSYRDNVMRSSISPSPFASSGGYDSQITIYSMSRMCLYYLIMFISFALIILFVVRISDKHINEQKSIDIALSIVSSLYFITAIVVAAIFVHQYLYKIIDKDAIGVAFQYDPHPEIRYMPRGTAPKLKHFLKESFLQCTRFQIAIWMCFIHQLIYCALYAIQYKRNLWNIMIAANKLLGAFGFILPSICIHIYCKEKVYIYQHFWKNSEIGSTSIQSKGKKRNHVTTIGRETKAIAASASILSSKMLMGCLCLGYMVQIVLFMADPWWNLTFYHDIEGNDDVEHSRFVHIAYNINQLAFRSFVGIFLAETIIVIMFVIMDRDCVNHSYRTLLTMFHPVTWTLLILAVLSELCMVLVIRDRFRVQWSQQIGDDIRWYVDIAINAFWMFVHFVVAVVMLRYAIQTKFVYEERLKRKISVFYAYIPSNVAWYVTESMLMMLICVCYLTQISLNHQFVEYERFDVYRQWVIYVFLAIETMLVIQLKQIQRCGDFRREFPSKTNYILYFHILTFVNLCDFCYVLIFNMDYFYREYNTEEETEFESFAFAFSFGFPAFLLLNMQHLMECYVNWKRRPETLHGIEMSKSQTLASQQK